MNPRGNPALLAEARRRHSLDKRVRILTILATLEKQGKPLTFAAVARAARVSTWLTYAPGVREHIEAAQLRQAHSTPPSATASPPSALNLRTELETARKKSKTSATNATGSRQPCVTNSATSSMPSTPLTAMCRFGGVCPVNGVTRVVC